MAPQAERIEELADILEVVHALAGKFGIDMAELGRAADVKRAERAGFNGGLWLVSRNK
jgi:predicted house-cleaning noncanonical NTP pyrophosphatase (MazG superfamily)